MTSPIAITLASHQLARKTGVFGNSAQAPTEFAQSDSAVKLLELFVRLDLRGSNEMSLHGHDRRDPSCNECGHTSRVHRNRTTRHSDLTCHLVGSFDSIADLRFQPYLTVGREKLR